MQNANSANFLKNQDDDEGKSSLPVPSRQAHTASDKSMVDGKWMKQIAFLDTSLASENLGDQIITEASLAVLTNLFPDAFFVRLTTHEFHLWESRRIIENSDLVFVGGSNLLKSNMMRNNQWKISPLDYFFRKECILLGCGWWYYQRRPNWYATKMLNKILTKKYAH